MKILLNNKENIYDEDWVLYLWKIIDQKTAFQFFGMPPNIQDINGKPNRWAAPWEDTLNLLNEVLKTKGKGNHE